MTKTEDLLKEIQKTLPKAKIAFKDQSKLMRFMGFLMFFNKSFMTNYITTLGYTVYFPSQAWVEKNDPWDVLAHEYVHMYDYKRLGPLMWLGYMFPQNLALLSLLSLLAIWLSPVWLLNIGWLVCVAPFPAPGRTYFELRGYVMSLMCDYGQYTQVSYDFYLKQFTGPDYYYMCPFMGSLTKKFEEAKARILSRAIFSEEPYKTVRTWMLFSGLVKR